MATPAESSPAPITAADTPRIAGHFRLQFETAQDAWVLLFPEGMIKLNQSAGEILQRCDGMRTVAVLVAELEQAFGQSGLEPEVLSFLGIAREQGWVTI